MPKKLEDITKGSVFMKHRKEHSTPGNNKTTEAKQETTQDDHSSSTHSNLPQPEDVREKEDDKKRLRRRRSSIDDTLADMKFGKGEYNKQNMEERKKQIIDNVFSVEGRTKTDPNPTSINTTPVKEGDKGKEEEPEP